MQQEADDVLVAKYAEAASSHGRATEVADYTVANEAAETVAEVYRELRRRGLPSQQLLLPLLTSPDAGIRCWAGAHALEFSPIDGERALAAMCGIPKSLVSFSAEMTLKTWRAGELKFP